MRLVALVLLVLASSSAAHEESISHSRVEVRGDRATLELRCQTLSLFEGIEGLDADLDGVFTEVELERAREPIGEYLLANWRLSHPGSEGEGIALEGRLVSIGFAEGIEAEARRFRWVDARVEFTSGTEIDELDVYSHLFTEQDPYHRDIVHLTWNDDGPADHLFRHGQHLWRFRPEHVRRPGVLTTFLHLGAEHILGGYDHLCFLVVLIVASRTWRSLLGVVTAFTVAHSITLALAALDVVDLDPGFVELAIALSIAYVAGENLLRRAPRTPWIEAFVFGLLHGLGFAGFLSDALVGERLVVTALCGFNLGVEAGQLLFVVGFAGLVWLPRRLLSSRGPERDPERPIGIVPAWLRLGSSAVVAVVALFWFVQRAGWIE